MDRHALFRNPLTKRAGSMLVAGTLLLAAGLVLGIEAWAPGGDAPPAPVTVYLDAVEKDVKVLGLPFTAWTYEGTIPGTIIRVTQGTDLTIVLRNAASEPHSVHTHFQNYELSSDGSSHTAPLGLVPHQADDPLGAIGATSNLPVHPGMGMNPIGPYEPRTDADIAAPGGTYTYKFKAEETGVLLYHCHVFPAKEHIDRGLFGAFIIYPPGWTWQELPPDPGFGNTKAWVTAADGTVYFEDVVMINEVDPTSLSAAASVPSTGPAGKIHLANFRAWNDPYIVGPVKTGTNVRLIVADIGDEVHSWHVHGHNFNIIDKFDPQQDVLYRTDVKLIGPGESMITTLVAGKPGMWFMHDHIVPDAYGGMVPWMEVTA